MQVHHVHNRWRAAIGFAAGLLFPRREGNRRRWTKSYIAKVIFYTSLGVFGLFVLASVVLLEDDRTISKIASTRSSGEVLDVVQRHLQVATYSTPTDQSQSANYWDVFEDKEFTAEYLDRGSWRVDAFYNLVRYYWHVDDITLKVTRDGSLEQGPDMYGDRRPANVSTIAC